MPLIDRIEVSNFMNVTRTTPWRADWFHSAFKLECENTAINIPNGKGKSTLMLAILGMLTWAGRDLEQIRLAFFAPRSTHRLTHVRIQVRIEDGVAPRGGDLVHQSGGEIGGAPLVIGMYANSGETDKFHLYTYEGTLDDCPVAHVDGNRRTLIQDSEFFDKLGHMPGHFPSNAKEATRGAWLRYIANLFDLPGLIQNFAYQRSNAAEGGRPYLSVPNRTGVPYSATLFYERLAPELLADVMGGLGEETEHGIEDTIHEKSRRVIQTRHQTEVTRRDLEKTERVLKELERLKVNADDVTKAKAAYDQHREEFSLELLALRNVVIENPIPGLPRRPAPHDPEIAEKLVLQGGQWYLPDRALGVFTGEESRLINERAQRHTMVSGLVSANKSQLIEITCDSFSAGTRGPAAKLYSRAAALNWINATNHFAAGWAKEEAHSAVETAFNWAEQHADTNPSRRLQRQYQNQIEELNSEKERLTELRGKYSDERDTLAHEQQTFGMKQAAYRSMADSNYFTVDELADPDATGRAVQAEVEKADRGLQGHIAKVSAKTEIYEKWKSFVAANGSEAQPMSFADKLADSCQKAEEYQQQCQGRLKTARDRRQLLSTAKKEAETKASKRGQLVAEIARHKPGAVAFQALFPEENPEGLAVSVKKALEDARKERHRLELAGKELEAPLAALAAFKNKYQEIEPNAWLHSRNREWERIGKLIADANDIRNDLKRQRTTLDTNPVAPGRMASEALAIAGGNYEPLHAAVKRMGLASARERDVLSLFSALLNAPVYANVVEATQAARNLSDEDNAIESPVFAFDELATFCHNGNITFQDPVAHGWIVGVRTRAVDCVLNPALVEEEKLALDAKILGLDEHLGTLHDERNSYDPNHKDVPLAHQAQAAITGNFRSKKEDITRQLGELDEKRMPRLLERASDNALKAIEAAVAYRRLLGDESEEVVQDQCNLARTAAEKAAKEYDDNEQQVESLELGAIDASETLNEARKAALAIDDLRHLGDFMNDTDVNPSFMESATECERGLKNALETARKRGAFQFDFAAEFVAKKGENRAREIEERQNHLKDEIEEIDRKQPGLLEKLSHIQEKFYAQSTVAGQIDLFIHGLVDRFRNLAAVLPDPLQLTAERLDRHPLYASAHGLREESSLESLSRMLLDIKSDTELTDTFEAKSKLQETQREYKRAVDTLHTNLDFAIGDKTLGLAEHVRMDLERAKIDQALINRHYDATLVNYTKNKTANDVAQQYLDKEWEQLGEWLQQFTMRLPTNLEIMQRMFNPKKDETGRVVRAGFIIEATPASDLDVHAVLNDIIAMIAKEEESMSGLNLEEDFEKRRVKDLRTRIRERFYPRVIPSPKIRVCIPSISEKPLLIEEKMVSSGQSIAMTLLWIIKMADYAAERDLSRVTVQQMATQGARMRKLRASKSSFVIVDGAFSHLSDKHLIDDALGGIGNTRGKLQLIITGHDPAYQNDFSRFPSFVQGREIDNRLMYADSETRRLLEPDEVGSHYGAMVLQRIKRVPITMATPES